MCRAFTFVSIASLLQIVFILSITERTYISLLQKNRKGNLNEQKKTHTNERQKNNIINRI